jgi:hypothetical protein
MEDGSEPDLTFIQDNSLPVNRKQNGLIGDEVLSPIRRNCLICCQHNLIAAGFENTRYPVSTVVSKRTDSTRMEMSNLTLVGTPGVGSSWH